VILRRVNFTKKQTISFIAILCILLVIPLTLVFLRRTQIIKQNALQTAPYTCVPDNGSIPYTYTAGSLEVYVHVIEANGDIGLIPEIHVRAEQKGNNLGTGVNQPQGFSDGLNCGFIKEGITDSSGHVNLEPLNCGHNNFLVSVTSGLPPDVVFQDKLTKFQPNGNDQNNVILPDIGDLPLQNGYAGILKLYYKRTASVLPTPTNIPGVPTATETPPPGATVTPIQPTPTPTLPPTCTYTNTTCGGLTPTENNNYCTNQNINSNWCFNGLCISCAVPPPPTPTPTPAVCPIPATVTNIHIQCPYCP